MLIAVALPCLHPHGSKWIPCLWLWIQCIKGWLSSQGMHPISAEN